MMGAESARNMYSDRAIKPRYEYKMHGNTNLKFNGTSYILEIINTVKESFSDPRSLLLVESIYITFPALP
jgi:hypothetical protein